jgi:hypothetical protein
LMSCSAIANHCTIVEVRRMRHNFYCADLDID